MIEKFVFDTNVLISAHLLGNSTSRRAFDKARTLGIIISSSVSLSEFANTFMRTKFDRYSPLAKRISNLREFEAQTTLLSINTTITECRDPKDNKFLELAVAAKASCIITGDKDLLVLHPFRKIPILNATDFINNF
jgi:putative PIN family toxin of toxin-antitoxin system